VGDYASEWFKRTTVEEMVEFVDNFKAEWKKKNAQQRI